MSDDNRKKFFGADPNVVFEGEPEDIDIEQATEEAIKNLSFNAEKLALILVDIGEKMLGVKLYDYQRDPAFRIIYSMLIGDGAEITMLFARQSGKSEIVAFCTVVIGVIFPVLGKTFKELDHFKAGVKMGLIAPQMDQVETCYNRCMERLLSEPCKVFLTDPDISDSPLSKVNFRLNSGSYLKGQSGAKQSKIESQTYHIVFIDESQDMDTEKVKKSIIPMTASTFGTIVRLGTPNRTTGDFYYTIQDNKKHDKALGTKNKKRAQKHFQYNYKEVIASKKRQNKIDGRKFHLLYEKAVNRDISKLTTNAESFRMSYNLEWLHEVGMFTTEDKLEEKVFDRRIKFPTLGKGVDGSFNVAGLDIAKARNSTVLTIGHIQNPALELGERPRKIVCGWTELKNTNYEEQFQIIARLLIDNGVKVLYLDYTGVGVALGDTLAYHLGDMLEIIFYNFNPTSKSELYKRLEEDMDASRFVVPARPEIATTEEFKSFTEQMVNLQRMWKGAFMVCEKTQGFNDDYCDSAALMNMAGNHLYAPPVEMQAQDNIFRGGRSSRDFRNNNKW